MPTQVSRLRFCGVPGLVATNGTCGFLGGDYREGPCGEPWRVRRGWAEHAARAVCHMPGWMDSAGNCQLPSKAPLPNLTAASNLQLVPVIYCSSALPICLPVWGMFEIRQQTCGCEHRWPHILGHQLSHTHGVTMCPVHGDPFVTGMPRTPDGATERRPASHSAWAESTRPFCTRTCRVCWGKKGHVLSTSITLPWHTKRVGQMSCAR